MSSVALIVGVVGAGASAAVASDSSRKALHAQQDAAKAGQVDIDSLDQKARSIANQNAIDSAALEQRMTPEVPQLRTASNKALLAGINDTSTSKAEGILNSQLGVPLNSPLLTEAIAKARGDLALGGKLPLDVQNLVTRHALATAGTAAPGQLNLGRDLTTRDLGLTSLQLEQQRLQNASQLGGQELGMAQDNSTNLLNQIQLLRAIHDSRFGQNLATAQYAEGIQRPVVGLDPSSVANLTVGNSNANSAALSNTANIRGQQSQNYAGLAGQALGYGLLAYNNRPQGGTPYSAPAGAGGMDVSTMMGSMCWVAREVYGATNPKWLRFRDWMLTKAPRSLFEFYMENGRRIAEQIRYDPLAKTRLRVKMDRILELA